MNTTAVNTTPNCKTPKSDPTVQQDGSSVNITATSVEDCTVSVSINQTASPTQYGVTAFRCPGIPSSQTVNVERQPVMFWYYNVKEDQTLEAETVFCAPSIEVFEVTGHASLNNNSITSCEKTGDYGGNPPLQGPPFNASVTASPSFHSQSGFLLTQDSAIAVLCSKTIPMNSSRRELLR